MTLLTVSRATLAVLLLVMLKCTYQILVFPSYELEHRKPDPVFEATISILGSTAREDKCSYVAGIRSFPSLGYMQRLPLILLSLWAPEVQWRKEELVFGCFITNLFFFQPHFCDVYKDMKVLLLAVYFFFFFFFLRALIDGKLARALVSVCFGPDLVVVVFFFFSFFPSCRYSISIDLNLI